MSAIDNPPIRGADSDYASTPSSVQALYGPDNSPYTFGPAVQLTDDVQAWLDAPQSNFGCMLIAQDKTVPWTARRCGSREEPDCQPEPQIQFVLPPRIDRAEQVGNQFSLCFTAQPGQIYTVQFCENITTPVWQPLAYAWTPTDATRFQLTDAFDAPQQFYRPATSR